MEFIFDASNESISDMWRQIMNSLFTLVFRNIWFSIDEISKIQLPNPKTWGLVNIQDQQESEGGVNIGGN